MRHLDYPRCDTWNHWRSVDTDFQDVAGSLSFLHWPIKEADTSVMTNCNRWPLGLPKMQDQKSLTLHWPSFPWWVMECFSLCFDYKSGLFIRKEQRHTIVDISRLPAGFLNATTNTTTQNTDLEIAPHWYSQTRPNPWVDGYGARFGPPRSSELGCWMVLDRNRTIFLVQTRTAGRLPGSVPDTTPEALLARQVLWVQVRLQPCLLAA